MGVVTLIKPRIKKTLLQQALKDQCKPGDEILFYKDLSIERSVEPDQWHLSTIALVFNNQQQVDALYTTVKP